ncbi:MAG: Holliday junction resolvase RuvX [Candidatus Marinimicrobia bacterium]|nr:Holliday junction resolvase RuvX [Candidatus Neomarinimicrobiota bacterium]
MGRILGVDYGDARVGLALTDKIKIIASPYKTLSNTNLDILLNEIDYVIKEKSVESIVLGKPIGLNGKETKQTKKVILFSKKLSKFKIPIFFEDERFSSISAKKSLVKEKIKTGYNKGLIDQRSAAIFLQSFLDKTKNSD